MGDSPWVIDQPEVASEGLITESEAARILCLSRRTLQGLRWKGGGPAFVRLGYKIVRYRRSDLDAYIRGKVITSTEVTGKPTNE